MFLFGHLHPEQVSCEPNPCKNFGTCTEIEKGFECTCKKGYTGKYCSSKYEKLRQQQQQCRFDI